MKRTNTAKWIESVHRWQINVQKEGKRKTFTCSKPGRVGQREANRLADEWLENELADRYKTVESAYGEFLQSVEQSTSTTNYRPVESRWRTWIKPVIGSKKLTSVTEQQLQKILNNAYAQGRSKKVIKNIKADIMAFFKFCRMSRYTDFEPEQIRIPAGARYKEKKILQPDDLKVLMTSEMTLYNNKEVPDKFIHLYRLSVLTGLRPGEIVALEWKDVQGNALHLRGAVNEIGEHTRGKNDNAIRSVILSPMAQAEIEAQRKCACRSKYVFGTCNQQLVRDWWKRYAKYNNITACTPYERRHTFVSAVQNLPEAYVKAIVGHSKNMDTFGVYGHAMNGMDDATAILLEQRFQELTK